MSRNAAINSYRQVSSAEASYATPHRLVQMLMGGAMDRIAIAKGRITHNQHDERHLDIKWTINVIEALRGALDLEQGGEIAVNLDSLYDYIIRRLYDADMQHAIEPLDEVTSLLSEIKSAWDAMPESLQHAADIKKAVEAMK